MGRGRPGRKVKWRAARECPVWFVQKISRSRRVTPTKLSDHQRTPAGTGDECDDAPPKFLGRGPEDSDPAGTSGDPCHRIPHPRLMPANTPIHQFFTEDHRRLDALLDTPGAVRMDLYHQFRTGLLKHIKMEEKILFPATQQANGGTPLPLAAKLRLEHGALTALMVTPPTPEVLRIVRSVLEQHDRTEEEQGGMYEACEKLTAGETGALLEALRQATEVPVHPHNETDKAFRAAKNALVRAGFDPGELAGD